MKIENVPAGDIFPKLKGNAAKLKLPKGVFDPKDDEDVRLETLVPREDPYYLFPGIHVVPLLVVAQNRDNMLIVGPTGVGKTILATQLGCKLNLPVTRLNFHGELGAPELNSPSWVPRNSWGTMDLPIQTSPTTTAGSTQPSSRRWVGPDSSSWMSGMRAERN